MKFSVKNIEVVNSCIKATDLCYDDVLRCGCGEQTDNPVLVQLVIVFGADVNGCNNNKETPRHKAATKTDSPNRL